MNDNKMTIYEIHHGLRKKNYLFGTFLFLLGVYLYSLVFHFRITASAIISVLIWGFIFLGGFLFFYYLIYRWVLPEMRQTRFHEQILLSASATMLSSAISIWFFQNYSIPFAVLKGLNHFLPAGVLENKPIDSYRAYFPLIIFVGMSVLLGFVFYGILWLILKKVKSQERKSFIHGLSMIAYALMLVSITSCIFSTDFLEIGPGQQSIIYYGGTENYITYRVMNDELNFWEDLQQYGGFIYGNNSLGDFQVYLSSTGFYGTLIKLGQEVTQIPPDKFLKGSRLLFGIIMAGILAAFSLEIKKHYGLLVSLIFSIFPVITYWFIGPSTHLIWFYFVLFIPFFTSVYLYPRVLTGKISRQKFLMIIFISEFLVFLKGYTFAPVLILSAAIPSFFYDLQARRKFKHILLTGIIICLAGTLAFFVVLTIHFFQLWLYTDSVITAKEYLIDRAIARSSSGDTNLTTPFEIFRNWLNVQVFYISRRIFAIFPQWYEPFNQANTFGNFHLMALASMAISFLLYGLQQLAVIRNPNIKTEIMTLFYLSLTTLVAMLSSWSWFPALGHMSHHYHMNGIMYMLPFGLCLFLLVALLIQTFWKWMATSH